MARGVANLVFTQAQASANAAATEQIGETVSVVQTDVSVVKTDVSQVQTDVSVVKTDVDEINVRTETKAVAAKIKSSLTDEHKAKIDALKLVMGNKPMKANLPVYNYNNRPVIKPDGKMDCTRLCGTSTDFMLMMSMITDIEMNVHLSSYEGWNGWDKSSLLQGVYDPEKDSDVMYAWTSSIPRQNNNQHIKASAHNVNSDYVSMVYNLAMEELILDIMGLSHSDLAQRLGTDISNGTIAQSRHADANAIINSIASYPTDIIHPQTVNFIALFMYGFVLATCSCAAFDDLKYSAGLLGVEVTKDSDFVYYFQSQTEKQEGVDNGNPQQTDFSQQWYEQVIRDTMALALCLDVNICSAYINGTYSLPTADPAISLEDKQTISYTGKLFTDTGEVTIYVPSGHPNQNEIMGVLEIMSEFNILQYLTTKYNAIYDGLNIISNNLNDSQYTDIQKSAAMTHRDVTNLIMSYGTNNDPGSNTPTDNMTNEFIECLYDTYNQGNGISISHVAHPEQDNGGLIVGLGTQTFTFGSSGATAQMITNGVTPKTAETLNKIGEQEVKIGAQEVKIGEQDLKVESSLGNGDNPAKKALELRGIYPMFNHPADAISYGAGNKCRPLYLDVTNNDGSITPKREFFVPSTPELIKGHHDSLKVPIELHLAPTDVAGALSENPTDYPLQSFDDMFLTDTASGVSEPVQTQIKSLDKVAIIPSRFLGLYDCAADLGEWTEPGVLGYRLHITERHVYISKFSHPTERSISYLVGHTACDAIHKSVLIHNKKQNVLVTTEPAGLHNGGRGAKFNRLLTSILGTNGQTYIVNKLQADAGMTLEDATEAYDSFKAHIEATTQPEYQSESVDARKPFEVFDGGALFNPVMSYLNGLLLSDQVFRTFVFDFEQAEVQMFEQSNVIDEVTYTPPIQAVIDVLLEDSPIRVEFDGTKQKCESRIRTKRFPRGSKLTMKLQPRTNNPNAAQTEESERENASEVYAGQSNLFLSWKRHEAAVTYFTAMAAAADPGDYKTYLSERVVDQRAIADAIKLQYSIVESVPEPGAPPPQVNFLVGNTVDLMGVGVENGKVVSGYHYLSDRIVSRPPVASGLTSPYLVASRNELKDSFESSIRAVFTKAELAKFEALRAKDITLTSSEYTYPLANKMSWTWRGTHGKFSGFCIQVALMLSELTGVKIQFDYTGLDGTGYPPQGYGLFGDPKADVGLFWVSTTERRKLGTAISIRKDLPENVKVMTHVNSVAALTANLLEPTLDTLAQFLHLDGKGFTLVKPPDGEFSPFEDIEVWLADPTNTPANPPIIITGEQFNQGTYTLNPHEYVFYKVLPAFPNGVESTKFYSLQVSDISIFIKNGIPHHDDIVECFEIIMKTGLTNSLAYVTSYQDAALEEDGLIPDEAARSWLTVPDTVGLSDATYTPVVLSKDNVLRDVASMRGLVNRLANDPPETDELSWFQNYKNYGGYVDPTAPVYYKNVRGLVCGLNDDETSDFVYKIYSTQAYNKLIQNLI